MKYRKKPVVIDAVQWTGENVDEVQAFLLNGHAYSGGGWVKGSYVEIGTLEGLMVASPGDWIIRGVKGEYYPCKPDIFDATYEAADAPTPPGQHSDDVAVDRFAAAMRAKLAQKRAEGRGGWDDPEQCPIERLAELLHEHVSKGDPIDVANFAMMLWCRGGRTTPPVQQDDEALRMIDEAMGESNEPR